MLRRTLSVVKRAKKERSPRIMGIYDSTSGHPDLAQACKKLEQLGAAMAGSAARKSRETIIASVIDAETQTVASPAGR